MNDDQQLAAPVRLILSDVDGVMTDGSIIYDSEGAETKAFHVRDGMGIKVWQKAGYRFGIITARSSEILRRRARELEITAVRQGMQYKWDAALSLMKEFDCTPEQTCYIGDDLPDLSVMRQVGLPIAVADAAQDVREAATWVMKHSGGRGAVRELIERLLRAKLQWDSQVNELLAPSVNR